MSYASHPRRRPVVRTVVAASAASVLCLAVSGCATAGGGGGGGDDADFPQDSIEIIVPFAAGGPTDTVTRIVAEPLGEELGVQIVVKNVEGAGGTVAVGEASQADADGYTLLMHHIGMSTAPSLYDDLNYDPVEDFAPIGLVTDVPMSVVSKKGLGPSDMAGLAEYAEENQATMTLANAGQGSASQLCGVLLQDALGVTLQEVPYDGTGPAMTDLLGGQVDLLCDQTTNTTSQILGEEIDVYGVTTPERVEILPDVPTTEEEGYEDIAVTVWHGLYAPAGTPDEVVDRLNEALVVALADESVIEQMQELGTSPVDEADITPAALEERLTEQIDTWAGILTASGS